jgi:hypothetical protein
VKPLNTLPKNLVFADISGDGEDEIVANYFDEGRDTCILSPRILDVIRGPQT